MVLASLNGQDSSGTEAEIIQRITGRDMNRDAAYAARTAHPPERDEATVEIVRECCAHCIDQQGLEALLRSAEPARQRQLG